MKTYSKYLSDKCTSWGPSGSLPASVLIRDMAFSALPDKGVLGMASSFWVQTPIVSREPVHERLLKVCNKIFVDAESNFLFSHTSMECDPSANLVEPDIRANSEGKSWDMDCMTSCSTLKNSLTDEYIALDLLESEASMSINSMSLECDEEVDSMWRKSSHCLRQRVVPWRYDRKEGKVSATRKSKVSVPKECLKCEAYARQCNIAAEQYERTLMRYTDVVRELITGFTSVMTYFPTLKTDHRGDKHLKYIIEAVLGRNDFIADILALAARKRANSTYGAESVEDRVMLSMTDALNSHFTDSEALRHTLRLYQTLYIHYIKVWREMSSRVHCDLPLIEFVRLTGSRPGVEGAEPWSEALSYAARMEEKMKVMVPRTIRDQCLADLRAIKPLLIVVPMGYKLQVPVRDAMVSLETIRLRLENHAPHWASDLQQTNLYLDVLADLTLMSDLISLGEISIKSLVYERRMLVAVVRKLSRDVYSLGGELTAPQCY